MDRNTISLSELNKAKQQGLQGLDKEAAATPEAKEKLEATRAKLSEPKHFKYSTHDKLTEEQIQVVIDKRNDAFSRYRVLADRIKKNKNRRTKDGTALFRSQKTVDKYHSYIEIINEADALINAYVNQV